MEKIPLSRILFKAKKQVFSDQIGNHRTQQKGAGYDFCELREYIIGDDIRHIDWMISAKIGKPFVKVFHKEHRLSILSVSVLGGSMHFGTHRLKKDLVANVVAILGFSAIKNVDFFASSILSDEYTHATGISRNIASVYKATNAILNFDTIGKQVNLGDLETLNFKAKRKSLIFLIGDFFEIPDLGVLSKRHEVVPIVIRDKYEEDLPKISGEYLIDPSDLSTFESSIGAGTAVKYKQKINKLDQDLEAYFRRLGLRFTKIYTHEDPFKKLSQLMRS